MVLSAFSTSAPLFSLLKWDGLTSENSWSGNAMLRVAMRRYSVFLDAGLSIGPNGVGSSGSRSSHEGRGGEEAASSVYACSRDLKSFLSRLMFLHEYASIRVWTEHSGPSCVNACARRDSCGNSMYFILPRSFVADSELGAGEYDGRVWDECVMAFYGEGRHVQASSHTLSAWHVALKYIDLNTTLKSVQNTTYANADAVECSKGSFV